jgi:NAD(P)-dependent dehydrogenase (short-subunit alcohol dehydrogenase family)
MGLFDGCTALVTGGGTGIGRGCARRLLEQGARVTLAARRLDVLEGAAEELRVQVRGAKVSVAKCDVTVEKEVEAAVRMAADATGRLDIAVANAGCGVPGPILALKSVHWRFANDLNILGTALTIKHAGLAMKARGGSIVAISSVNGVMVSKYMAPYSVSKAGLEMLVRCAAIELAPFRIRVNCIQPGYVPTEGTQMAYEASEIHELLEKTPLERPGHPEEIGDGVVYFSAPSGAWVTGQVLAIDGGMSISLGESVERLCRTLHGNALMDECVGPSKDREADSAS